MAYNVKNGFAICAHFAFRTKLKAAEKTFTLHDRLHHKAIKSSCGHSDGFLPPYKDFEIDDQYHGDWDKFNLWRYHSKVDEEVERMTQGMTAGLKMPPGMF